MRQTASEARRNTDYDSSSRILLEAARRLARTHHPAHLRGSAHAKIQSEACFVSRVTGSFIVGTISWPVLAQLMLLMCAGRSREDVSIVNKGNALPWYFLQSSASSL
jgi:hypothetical protein